MFYVADREGHPESPTLDHVYVSLGSLTGSFSERAVAHTSYEERVPWHETRDLLPKFHGKTEQRIA